MAEVKKEAPKEPKKQDWLMFAPFIAIGVLIFVSAFITGNPVFNSEQKTSNAEQIAKKNLLSPYSWIGTDELKIGTAFINFKEIPIRNSPGGMVIGVQKKLETGIVRAGPMEAFDVEWFRVEYAQAPSGWIDTRYVSTNISGVRALNIIPILYGYFKYVGYALILIFFIILVILGSLLSKETEISKKKLQLKRDSARPAKPSIQEQIIAKPDVQEIPGFQTEEIVPIQILEQENRWQHIQDLIKSYNPNDWRQAIIEADIILEEMLEKMGYQGVTIGDKLKTVERSDFVTLDRAWSAHKIRNQIAHSGSSFKLSREIADKTIKEYEEVFREFYYI